MTDSTSPTPENSRPKKPYQRPQLAVFGDVRRLTGGATGTMMTDSAASTSMACWIAEALYGIGSTRVVLVRSWLARCHERRIGWAMVVVPRYRWLGRPIARAIRAFPVLQRPFRPLFDRAVVHASRDRLAALRGRA